MESTIRTKILAGAGMVCISTTVGILYKASQAASGGFKYSTTGAICMAEFVKLAMSAGFHLFDKSHGQSLQVKKAVSNAMEQLSFYAFRHIYFLAILYMINNQLSFYIYTMVDPGTVFLFKAASTMIVAAVQCTFAGKKFTWEQWKAMMLQACGMITVQYDPCKGAGVYSPFAYGCLCLSTAITAISAARNEFLVKNFQITLNVQNAVLYSGGVIFNLLAFLLLPNPNSKNANIGFFEGYDFLAIGVVCSNALIGIVITAVYKYADAVVKCIASDITAVLLIILSSFFFGLHSSLTMWCGVFTVTFAVHLYIDASSKASAKPSEVSSGQSSQTTVKKEMELSSVVGREAREDKDEVDAEEAESLVRNKE
eukprot:s1157_g16.t1